MKSILLTLLILIIPIQILPQAITQINVPEINDLSGKWKFIPQDNLEFASPDFNDSNWISISMPGLWRSQNLADVTTGWYRKNIYIKELNGNNISILSPAFIDAHEFYFNGVKIGEEGKIDSSGKCIVNNSRYNIYHIPDSLIFQNSINRIAIRICNFSGFAGVSGELFIGETNKIKERFYASMVWNVSVGLVFLFVSLYHLILFLGSKKDLSYIYFSISCFFASTLTLGYFRFSFWITDSFWFHYYFYNSGFGLIVLFIVLFIHYFFDYEISGWVKLINYLVALTFTIFLFSSMSLSIFTFYVKFGQPFMMLMIIPYSFSISLVIFNAIRDNKKGAKIISFGLFVLILTFFSSLLLYFNFIQFINILPEAFLTFVLSIAIALSAKFYGVNEQVLLLEKKHSEELERKIQNRTKDLEDAKKTAEIETGIAWIAQRESQVEKEKTEKLLKEIQKDMLTAQKIQQNILPHDQDKILSLKIATLYKPVSSVGGDFYDIAEIENGLVRFFIADATGHGVQAALITMAIKSEYESVKYLLDSPSKILQYLNDNFFNKYKSLNIYFTAFIIDIDTNKNKIKYSSAGHVPQMLISKDKVNILSQRGNIIGLIPNVDYDEDEKDFTSGRIFLFTDGIEEEFNVEQEQFGEDRVMKVLIRESKNSIQDSLDSLYAEMNKFIDTVRVRDDITIIGIEYSK